jgi:hypothetical protein
MRNENSTWKRNVLAIAALFAATVTTAPAQSLTMKAEVPFEFSVNHASNLAPGTYIVTHDRNVWIIRNETVHRAVFVTPVAAQGKANDKPSLTFQCVGTSCRLRAINAGYGQPGGELPAPHLSKSDAAEIAMVTVPLQPNRGE